MDQAPRAGNTVARTLAFGGGLAFVASLVYFLYSYVDRFGPAAGSGSGSAWRPALIDLGLLAAFGLHHSAFARLGLKRWIEGRVTPAGERSVYVWVSSALFVAVCVAWQPVPGDWWTAAPAARPLFYALQVVGIIISVRSASRLDVLELAGIRQVLGGARRAPELLRSGAYGLVRHPVYLGWLLIIWWTPVMTGTRLVFAAATTIYLIVAIPLEERDLMRTFGATYEEYRRRVRWRMIPFVF